MVEGARVGGSQVGVGAAQAARVRLRGRPAGLSLFVIAFFMPIAAQPVGALLAAGSAALIALRLPPEPAALRQRGEATAPLAAA